MIFNEIQFDDINSKNYGVYVTGSAAFNSPSRDVEMVTVPGRNGDLILDNGRFNNIEVTYPAGTFGSDETDFRTKMRDFRNALASKKGYQRLTDSYNPDEYRMATFVNAIEAEPVGHNIAAEFDLVFNCKPQRFLTSGETETSVANNGTITNPTPYESSPLIMTEGYGTIKFNGSEIIIQNVQIGDVLVAPGGSFSSGYNSPQTTTVTINNASLNNGDTITFNSVEVGTSYTRPGLSPGPAGGIILVSTSNLTATTGDKGVSKLTTNTATFTHGTSSTFTATANCKMTISNTDYAYIYTISIAYNGSTTFTITASDNASLPTGYKTRYDGNTYSDIVANSTKSALGNPTYIDCDLGECYMISGGEMIQLNSVIGLGSKLPTLASGTNTFNYSNTITSFKVVPRWWLL